MFNSEKEKNKLSLEGVIDIYCGELNSDELKKLIRKKDDGTILDFSEQLKLEHKGKYLINNSFNKEDGERKAIAFICNNQSFLKIKNNGEYKFRTNLRKELDLYFAESKLESTFLNLSNRFPFLKSIFKSVLGLIRFFIG